MDFQDNTFNSVLCQHVLMNIEDKSAAIKEFYRVLKPGGKLILHEVTKGSNSDGQFQFPVPWASQDSISFLQPWDYLANTLEAEGFTKLLYSDESDAALLWQERAKKALEKRVFNTKNLGPGLIFGDNAQFFAKNMYKNLKDNIICLVGTVYEKKNDA